MKDKTITFEQLPSAVQQIMDEVKSLSQKIDKMSEKAEQGASRDIHRVIYVDEVCKMIRKTRNTLYSMTSKGLIPSYKQGKYLYFFEDEILDWIKRYRKNDRNYLI
jgi:predicted DNA-binding transcriptional regulator AlpA